LNSVNLLYLVDIQFLIEFKLSKSIEFHPGDGIDTNVNKELKPRRRIIQ